MREDVGKEPRGGTAPARALHAAPLLRACSTRGRMPLPLLIAAGHHLGHHHHLIASGAAGVPAAPLWIPVLLGAIVIVAIGLYWASTRA